MFASPGGPGSPCSGCSPLLGPFKENLVGGVGGGLLSDTDELRLKLPTGLGRYKSRVSLSAFVCTSIRATVNPADITLKEVMEAKRDVQRVVGGASRPAMLDAECSLMSLFASGGHQYSERTET